MVAHNPVTQMLATQIEEGIKEIDAANEILLAADESGTGVRAIDKALKEGTDNETVNNAWAEAEKAKEAFRQALDNARNLYRTEILNEDAQESAGEVDKDEVRAKRKVVIESLNLIKTFAEANGMADVLDWANNLEVPQVGRNASSTLGQRKVRAFVHVDGSVFDTFGEAAKHVSSVLSDEDTKVNVTPGDLQNAWIAAGEVDGGEFDYEGCEIKVVLKPKKSDA